MVNDGTSATAQAVTLVWNDDTNGWTAVTGSGEYADRDVVFAFAEAVADKPQKADLRLGMAPGGWIVAVFGQSEILFGMLPGGGTQRLPRHIGPGRALEMILEGSTIDAQQSLDYGLVQHLVPDDELLTTTQAAASRLASRPRAVVAAAKRLTYAATDRPLRSGLDHELAAFMAAGTAPTPKQALPLLAADIESHSERHFLPTPKLGSMAPA